jgi:hypothetical protein
MTQLAHRLGAAVPAATLLVLSAACAYEGTSPWVDCGGSGQACCAGSACSGALACNGGKCQACGGSGQSCCASGTACEGTLICQSGTCKCPSDFPVYCSYPGDAACTGCWEADTDCTHPVTSCSDGSCHYCTSADEVFDCTIKDCVDCGGQDQPCCSSGAPCSGTLTCQSSTCKPPPCGDLGQACCASGTACTGDLKCQSGTCQCTPDFPVFCSYPGNATCTGCWAPGTECSRPVTTCSDNSCHSCKTLGNRYDCTNSTCVAGCGGNGQPCCTTGTQCTGTLTCQSGSCQCSIDRPIYCDHAGDSTCTGCWSSNTDCSLPVVPCAYDGFCHACLSAQFHFDCATRVCVAN